MPANLAGGLNALFHGEDWHGDHNFYGVRAADDAAAAVGSYKSAMTASRAGVAIALAALGLSACEDRVSFRLHNATGAAMAVLSQEGGYFPHTLHVDPGESAKLYILGEDIRLTGAGCEARYLVPEYYPFNYPWRSPDGSKPDYRYAYPIEVQVESDLTLYLRPAKAKGVTPLKTLKQRQAHGFPLKPVSKTCR